MNLKSAVVTEVQVIKLKYSDQRKGASINLATNT